MPEITFVLPHWMYWSGLVVFPLLAYFVHRKARADTRTDKKPVSNLLAYFLLVTGGFIGCHRLYVKSAWAAAFIVLFVALLFVNVETRHLRTVASGAKNEISLTESRIERAERNIKKAEDRLSRTDNERNRERLDEEKAKLDEAAARLDEARARNEGAQENYHASQRYASYLAALLLALLVIDALLLPRLVRKRNQLEGAIPASEFACPASEQETDPSRERFAFNRIVGRANGFIGEFVAYWSVIAVFVYYYEVISRYVFNSPTNWAHEAMFLMFGMQYLIAGGFVLREGAHVRVDVIYTNLSRRTKAILDLITSVFFFIFVVTLLVTGWIFFHDSLGMQEVSFTEWAIQYYPIKFALPLGAALLLLQGIAQLLNDIDVVRGTAPDARQDDETDIAIEESRHGT